MKRHWSSILRTLAALGAVVLLVGAAAPAGARAEQVGAAVAQESVQLWEEPRISIVWPHDGRGNATPVASSRMVNVSVWPSNQVACCRDPGFALLVARDNEPAQVVQSYGHVQVIERTVGGVTFPSVEFNNIPADLAAEPGARYRFALMDGSNVWVHAADPRTIFPQQVVPAGYSEPRPQELDARIQVVWPHDEQGRLRPVAEAPLVNIAVDLFAHGTLNSVPLDYEPEYLRLQVAQGNDPLALQRDLLPEKTTYTANGQTFPRWVFNNVPVEPGRQYHFAPYVVRPKNKGLPSWSFTIWTHAADARTLLPNPEPPKPVAASAPEIGSLVVAPGEPARLYAVVGGRLYRSEDGGQPWAAEGSAGLPTGADVRKVAIDYQRPEALYLTTAQGIYRREGQGEWRLVNALRASALAVDFRDPNVLWAGGSKPDLLVQKSTDGGRTWARADAGMTTLSSLSVVTDIQVDPDNPDMLWAVTLAPSALWRRAGNGQWERLNLGAFDPGPVPEEAGDDTGYPAGIAYDANANLLFVGCTADDHNHGAVLLLRSPNADAPDAGAIRWELAARFPPLADPLWSQGSLRPLAVDAREPKSLFAALSVYDVRQAQGSNQLFVSHDAGANWQEIALKGVDLTP